MSKYVKRPVVIEAFRYGFEKVPKWFQDKVDDGNIDTFIGTDLRCPEDYYCNITTLEGTMRGDLGDYIIKGVEGEIYPCKHNIFNLTYKLVSNES